MQNQLYLLYPSSYYIRLIVDVFGNITKFTHLNWVLISFERFQILFGIQIRLRLVLDYITSVREDLEILVKQYCLLPYGRCLNSTLK